MKDQGLPREHLESANTKTNREPQKVCCQLKMAFECVGMVPTCWFLGSNMEENWIHGANLHFTSSEPQLASSLFEIPAHKKLSPLLFTVSGYNALTMGLWRPTVTTIMLSAPKQSWDPAIQRPWENDQGKHCTDMALLLVFLMFYYCKYIYGLGVDLYIFFYYTRTMIL